MNELKITRVPVGWQKLSSTSNEAVLAMSGRCTVLFAKIMLLPYTGSEKALRMEMEQHLSSVNFVDCERGKLLCNNIKWYSSYYVCREEKERYRATFYAVFDGCCVVLEMLTESELLRVYFLTEAKRLMHSVDYSAIAHDNRIDVKGRVFRVKVSNDFRVNALSSNECLIFLGENRYLFVNVPRSQESLRDIIEEQVSSNYLGMEHCNIAIDEEGCNSSNVEWIRYVVLDGDHVVGYGTYLRHTVSGEQIVSFLFEHGSGCRDPMSILAIRGD